MMKGMRVTTKSMDGSNWIKQLLVVGIGTTSLVAEKLREVTDQWVREGRIDPEQAKAFVDEMLDRMKVEQGSFEAQLERQMRSVMQDLGVPNQSEIDELRGRIDRLEHQLRNLENKLWK
jgi:polyhydroxyalkanoate synthesis regulator phasin